MPYNQQQSINFVKDYLLPFVNSTESTRELELKKLYQSGIANYLSGFDDYDILDIIFNELKSKSDFIDRLNQLHGLTFKMLTIALVENGYSKYYPESELTKLSIGERFDPNDFEKQLQEIINSNSKYSRYTWRGPCKCFNSSSYAASNNVWGYISYVIIEMITDLFHSTGSSEDGNFEQGPGYQYFAACSKCSKFFYRSRKSQEFCSRNCSIAMAAQRFRNNHK